LRGLRCALIAHESVVVIGLHRRCGPGALIEGVVMELNIGTGFGGLIVALLCAWVAYQMAKTRRREAALWAALGFFFPCLSILVLLVIGKKQ